VAVGRTAAVESVAIARRRRRAGASYDRSLAQVRLSYPKSVITATDADGVHGGVADV